MELTPLELDDARLRALEATVRRALARGDAAELEVLGYGEISTVIAIDGARGRLAAKRLPPFDGRARFDAYRALFADYLATLAAAGVKVLASELRAVPWQDGGVVGYCLQPALAPARLGPRVLAAASPDAAAAHAETLVATVLATVEPRRGLDAQLSNWALLDDGWCYLDVTTPLLRDAAGRDLLDADLFVAMLPALLRPLVRRFLLPSILATYFEPRRVVLDLLANLLKERLDVHLPAFVAAANRRLEPATSEAEVRACYASDARLWAALLALRRLDRSWHLRVRRRPYPFLLPGKIER